MGRSGVLSQQSLPQTFDSVQQRPPRVLTLFFGWWTFPGGQQMCDVVPVTSRSGGQQTLGESLVMPALSSTISFTHSFPLGQQVWVPPAPDNVAPTKQHVLLVVQQSPLSGLQQNSPEGQQVSPHCRGPGHGVVHAPSLQTCPASQQAPLQQTPFSQQMPGPQCLAGGHCLHPTTLPCLSITQISLELQQIWLLWASWQARSAGQSAQCCVSSQIWYGRQHSCPHVIHPSGLLQQYP
jgi:hypothetical protein